MSGFYRSIGFEVVSYDEGYARVSHLGHELLHLRHVPDLAIGMNEAACFLHVSDADASTRRCPMASMSDRSTLSRGGCASSR